MFQPAGRPAACDLICMSKKKRRIALINTDDESARAICAAAGIAEPVEPDSLPTPDAAAAYLAESGACVMFVGLEHNTDEALAAVQAYRSNATQSAIIAVSDRVSSEMLLQAVHAGVDEFLTKPLNSKSIREAVENACRKRGVCLHETSGGGKVFTIFSGKGGCGKTMLATNLAYHLAQLDDGRVVTVDLNLQFGNAATFLDLQPRHTIMDCIHRDEVVEDEVLVRMPCQHASGLSVLPGPADPADAELLRPEHITALLEAFRRLYDFVLVDTSSNFDERCLAALDVSDKIILLSDTLVPSVRNTQRCAHVFEKLGYDPDRLMLVINRWDKRVGAGPKELQQAFDLPIAGVVPNDFSPVMSAVDAGLPVAEVAERSEVVTAIEKLARRLAGDQDNNHHDAGLLGKLTALIGK